MNDFMAWLLIGLLILIMIGMVGCISFSFWSWKVQLLLQRKQEAKCKRCQQCDACNLLQEIPGFQEWFTSTFLSCRGFLLDEDEAGSYLWMNHTHKKCAQCKACEQCY